MSANISPLLQILTRNHCREFICSGSNTGRSPLQASSCAGPYTTPCPAGSQTNPNPNPWTLTGALVNGPLRPMDSTFVDQRTEPDTAVSIEFNAGYTSKPSPSLHCISANFKMSVWQMKTDAYPQNTVCISKESPTCISPKDSCYEVVPEH